MKYSIFLSLIAVFMNLSCSKSQNNSITFEKHTFNLPEKAKKLHHRFKFDTYCNGAFSNGNVDNRNIIAHTKYKTNQQIVDEVGNHLNETIVGLTFYKKCTTHKKLKVVHKKYMKQLEEKHKKKFNELSFSFFTSLTGKYYYMNIENDVFLVLGDVMYNKRDNNYVVISFFRGVSENQLTSFLEHIY